MNCIFLQNGNFCMYDTVKLNNCSFSVYHNIPDSFCKVKCLLIKRESSLVNPQPERGISLYYKQDVYFESQRFSLPLEEYYIPQTRLMSANLWQFSQLMKRKSCPRMLMAKHSTTVLRENAH